MPDLIHKLLKFIDHNRYLAIALGFALTILVTVTACQPTANSPFDDSKVTEARLVAQAQAYQAALDAKVASNELTYQQAIAKVQADYEASLVELGSDAQTKELMTQAALDEIEAKKRVMHMAIESLASFGANAAGPQYAPLINTALGIAGVIVGAGAAADNRRKDKIIELKARTATG